jgi:DNA mismatch repair protein MutS
MKDILKTPFPTILDATSVRPPEADPLHPRLDTTGVLDQETYQSLEVPKLFGVLNRTQTRIGASALLRSLANPLVEIDEIKAKQDTLAGLQSDAALRSHLEGYVGQLAQREASLYQLLYGTFLGLFGSKAHELEFEGFGYDAFIRGTEFLTQATHGAHGFKPTGLDYLDAVLGSIRDFKETRGYRLARGPVYRTEKGVIPREEKHWWTPCVRFNPSLFKPVGILVFIAMILVVSEFVPLLLDMVASMIGTFWIFLFPLGLLYIPIVGGFDRDGCIYPFRDVIKRAPEVHRLLDDIGRLDELLSLLAYRDSLEHPTTLPEIKTAKQHTIQLKSVKNPILATENAHYVGNDIDLAKPRLTLITGPNSGGKTAFCKTLAQSQLLAQAGAFVVAEDAALTVADRIFHQAPEISQLADGEGRFGTELRRTKAIFMASTAQSLVIMDELSEGTTHEEKIEISKNILDGFAKKGSSTLLITHNHALVDQYIDRSEALTRQVEFAGGKPTFRLISGISRVSHADKVAARIGFTKADIDRHLEEEKKPAKPRKPRAPKSPS